MCFRERPLSSDLKIKETKALHQSNQTTTKVFYLNYSNIEIIIVFYVLIPQLQFLKIFSVEKKRNEIYRMYRKGVL